MKLILVRKKIKHRKNVLYGKIIGYVLPSRGNKFNISGTTVKNITITNKKLAHPFVILQVNTRFKKLIDNVVELLISDDDTGQSARIALDKIEKFRQLIKNEYRIYLKRNELEIMARKLEKYQKEAAKRFSYMNRKSMIDNIGKSR